MHRIQLKRTRGYRKPPEAVVVSRPSRYGNPFRPQDYPGLDPAEQRHRAVADFTTALLTGKLPYSPDDVRRELAGHPLACWCPLDQPCHADVLLCYANDKKPPEVGETNRGKAVRLLGTESSGRK